MLRVSLEQVLRLISSLVLSPLLVVTLFWGGCVACPQFFMFPGADAVKDCCKAGQCDRSQSPRSTPIKECKRMPLELGSSMQYCAEPPILTGSATDVIRPVIVHHVMHDPVAAVGHSPPDLQILNATFLI